jgi:hypothetical protein
MDYLLCIPARETNTRENCEKIHNVLARMSDTYKLRIVPEPVKNKQFPCPPYYKKYRIYKPVKERDTNGEAYLEKLDGLKKRQEKLKQEISGQSVILFHEAYAYVAEDYGLQVNYLLDLDEERQVSAGEVSDVLSAVRKGHVKYILAEELYGKSMGDTIRKESDAKVLYLDPLNRGTYEKDSYINGMKKNMEILEEAFYAKDH